MNFEKDPIAERAEYYLKNGWEVEERSLNRWVLLKRYSFPRQHRRHVIWIENGYYGRVLWHRPPDCPDRCERCAERPGYHSVILDGHDAIRVCQQCYKSDDSTAIVEWGWASQTLLDKPVNPVLQIPAAMPNNPPQGGAVMLQSLKDLKEQNLKIMQKAEQIQRLISAIEELQDLKVDIPEHKKNEDVYGWLTFTKTYITLGQHFTSAEFNGLIEEIDEAVRDIVDEKVAMLKQKLEQVSK